MILINEIEQRIINGGEISFQEALQLIHTKDNDKLFTAANNIRKYFLGNKAEICSIMNAKSGKCTENCIYCAQSKSYKTDIIEYPVVEQEEALKLAIHNEGKGVHRFSLVTSGRGLRGEDFEKVLEIYKTLNKQCSIKLCASHGILTYEQLIRLKEVGVTRYHHNIEASRAYYEKICTSHTFEDRINTIKNAQKAGIQVCSGGIIGLGESMEDRISMAFELKAMNILSIPINILNPIKGTPLEKAEKLEPLEILKVMAIFRFINPTAYIRYAGGRNNLGTMQPQGLQAGINATITGDFLTTSGNNIEDDISMFSKLGFEV